MDRSKIAEQTAEFASLMQRAQELAQRSSASALAKATGNEFSVLDSGTVAQAYARVGMKLAQNPFALAQFQIDLWSNSAKAWAGAWTGEGEDSKDHQQPLIAHLQRDQALAQSQRQNLAPAC